jgi:hypothetical protein
MKPVTLNLSVTAYFNVDEIPAIYSDEEMFSEAIKEHVMYALERLDAQDIVFNSIDLEGLS